MGDGLRATAGKSPGSFKLAFNMAGMAGGGFAGAAAGLEAMRLPPRAFPDHSTWWLV
jgi:hypothetical protein